MKNTLIILVLLLMGMTLHAQSGGVEVEITGIVAEWGGSISIGLFEKKGFPKEGQAITNRVDPVRGIKSTVKFENMPVGNYAIAVFQDVNTDGKLNRTIYGQPTEPYAFSNNVFGKYGPPKFASVAFSVDENTNSKLVIHLKE